MFHGNVSARCTSLSTSAVHYNFLLFLRLLKTELLLECDGVESQRVGKVREGYVNSGGDHSESNFIWLSDINNVVVLTREVTLEGDYELAQETHWGGLI